MESAGTFEVKLQPLETYAAGQAGIRLGRFSIEKTFHGDLQAQSRGEMLSANTDVEGSAGYVAIEQVQGSLHGRAGSFVLQHFGVMQAGNSRLQLEVLPDSGTGELEGLSGQMSIRIEAGKYVYSLDYSLGDAQAGKADAPGSD